MHGTVMPYVRYTNKKVSRRKVGQLGGGDYECTVEKEGSV